jgi:hypothetical protein
MGDGARTANLRDYSESRLPRIGAASPHNPVAAGRAAAFSAVPRMGSIGVVVCSCKLMRGAAIIRSSTVYPVTFDIFRMASVLFGRHTHVCHELNEDPINGCQIGTKVPTLHAK